MNGPVRIRLHVARMLGLSLAVSAVYARTVSYPFIVFDDIPYILENPALQGGFTPDAIRWAFTTGMDSGWIPLTWLSRLLDVSLFGMDAGGHHLVNVLFHLANVLLLFHALRRMTGRPWESWFVAALFAVHPLHVESVAWVTERKDVLAGFFWMLSLWAYARYSERPGLSRYLAVALCFALGLMSKPIVVTLPFVLLLLDFWPLGRLRLPGDAVPEGAAVRPAPWRRLVLEKAPLLAMSAAASAATLVVQQRLGAVATLESFPLPLRVANALQSCVLYLWKTAWPARLSVFYPHPGSGISPVAVAASALLLAVVTALALRSARSRRWLAVGWFWFLGTLVPVIGVVQVGMVAMADRFAYIPAAGIYIMAVWGASGFLSRWKWAGRPLLAASSAVLVALAVRAHAQAGKWRDSQTLFISAIASTSQDNFLARLNLGGALMAAGDDERALAEYREALRIAPDSVEPRASIGVILSRRGEFGEAERLFREALRLRPDFQEARMNLGTLLSRDGRTAEAIALLREALRMRPDYGEAHLAIGVAMAKEGRTGESLEHLRAAVRLRPRDAEARNNLGALLARSGAMPEAVAQFREAIRLRPDYEGARRNLLRAEGGAADTGPGAGREAR